MCLCFQFFRVNNNFFSFEIEILTLTSVSSSSSSSLYRLYENNNFSCYTSWIIAIWTKQKIKIETDLISLLLTEQFMFVFMIIKKKWNIKLASTCRLLFPHTLCHELISIGFNILIIALWKYRFYIDNHWFDDILNFFSSLYRYRCFYFSIRKKS